MTLERLFSLPTRGLPSARLDARVEAVVEAVGWEGDDGLGGPVFTPVYSVGGLEAGVWKPGKEADESRSRVNGNDMAPTLRYLGRDLESVPKSFGEMWATFEALAQRGDKTALAVCGGLLYRNAYLLDHEKDGPGGWRYAPSSEALAILAAAPVDSELIRPDVLMYYLDLVALNEDVKYWTLRRADGNPYDLKTTGRPNNLRTALTFIVTLLRMLNGERSLGAFADAMSRGRGVAPGSLKVAREVLLDVRL